MLWMVFSFSISRDYFSLTILGISKGFESLDFAFRIYCFELRRFFSLPILFQKTDNTTMFNSHHICLDLVKMLSSEERN
jgi:hypothetical protein